MLMVGCDRSDQPVPVEAAVTDAPAVTVGEGDPDGALSFRTCDPSSGQCLVTIDVTPNTASYYVCGILPGSTSCYKNTSCGEVVGGDDTFTGDDEFCITAERLFYIENTGLTDITVNASSFGGSSGAITISSGEIAVFEANALCMVNFLCID